MLGRSGPPRGPQEPKRAVPHRLVVDSMLVCSPPPKFHILIYFWPEKNRDDFYVGCFF